MKVEGVKQKESEAEQDPDCMAQQVQKFSNSEISMIKCALTQVNA